MSRREIALAAALVIAGSLVTAGVSDVSTPAAKIVAGLLLAGLAVLFLTEVVE